MRRATFERGSRPTRLEIFRTNKVSKPKILKYDDAFTVPLASGAWLSPSKNCAAFGPASKRSNLDVLIISWSGLEASREE